MIGFFHPLHVMLVFFYSTNMLVTSKKIEMKKSEKIWANVAAAGSLEPNQLLSCYLLGFCPNNSFLWGPAVGSYLLGTQCDGVNTSSCSAAVPVLATMRKFQRQPQESVSFPPSIYDNSIENKRGRASLL